MDIFSNKLILLNWFLLKSRFNIKAIVNKTEARPKAIEIKNKGWFKMLVKYGIIKNTIANNANTREKVVDFLTPIWIASVFTPWLLSEAEIKKTLEYISQAMGQKETQKVLNTNDTQLRKSLTDNDGTLLKGIFRKNLKW